MKQYFVSDFSREIGICIYLSFTTIFGRGLRGQSLGDLLGDVEEDNACLLFTYSGSTPCALVLLKFIVCDFTS